MNMSHLSFEKGSPGVSSPWSVVDGVDILVEQTAFVIVRIRSGQVINVAEYLVWGGEGDHRHSGSVHVHCEVR